MGKLSGNRGKFLHNSRKNAEFLKFFLNPKRVLGEFKNELLNNCGGDLGQILEKSTVKFTKRLKKFLNFL